MGFDNLDTRGHFLSGIVLLVLAGVIFGLGSLFVKLAISKPDIWAMAMYPVSWLALLFALLGFVLMQKAMHDDYVSIVTPFVTGMTTFVSVIVAFILLGENVTITRWVGVLLILIGAIIICMVKKK